MHKGHCVFDAKNASAGHEPNICSWIRAFVWADRLTSPFDVYELHRWQRVSVFLIVMMTPVSAE
jgi:hypothetical protein